MADYYQFDPAHRSAARATSPPLPPPPFARPLSFEFPVHQIPMPPDHSLSPSQPQILPMRDTFSSPPQPTTVPQHSLKPTLKGRGRRKVSTTKPEDYSPSQPHVSGSNGASTTALRQVNIKTKFPVARIKRIMQADEDVGKVAQVTPVVVSKALELFMISLCDKASEQARQRNSKRITAGHLKQAILHEEQFDFLADIIEKVQDIPVASESGLLTNGGEYSEDGAAPVKKTRKPRQRKSKDNDSY